MEQHAPPKPSRSAAPRERLRCARQAESSCRSMHLIDVPNRLLITSLTCLLPKKLLVKIATSRKRRSSTCSSSSTGWETARRTAHSSTDYMLTHSRSSDEKQAQRDGSLKVHSVSEVQKEHWKEVRVLRKEKIQRVSTRLCIFCNW